MFKGIRCIDSSTDKICMNKQKEKKKKKEALILNNKNKEYIEILKRTTNISEINLIMIMINYISIELFKFNIHHFKLEHSDLCYYAFEYELITILNKCIIKPCKNTIFTILCNINEKDKKELIDESLSYKSEYYTLKYNDNYNLSANRRNDYIMQKYNMINMNDNTFNKLNFEKALYHEESKCIIQLSNCICHDHVDIIEPSHKFDIEQMEKHFNYKIIRLYSNQILRRCENITQIESINSDILNIDDIDKSKVCSFDSFT
jgi:hypothetical protein